MPAQNPTFPPTEGAAGNSTDGATRAPTTPPEGRVDAPTCYPKTVTGRGGSTSKGVARASDTKSADGKQGSSSKGKGFGRVDSGKSSKGARGEGKGGDVGRGEGSSVPKSSKSGTGGGRAEGDSMNSTGGRAYEKSKEKGRLDDPYNDPDLDEDSADAGNDPIM